MSALPPIYELLCQSRNGAADDALAEALPFLGEPHRTHAVTVLLQRGESTGMRALIARYADLSNDIRRRIISAISRFPGALRDAIHEPDLDTRLNAIAMVRTSGNLRLVDLAATALHDSSPRVREAAAETLLSLARGYFNQLGEILATATQMLDEDQPVSRTGSRILHLLAEERGYLTKAISDALASFVDHHHLEVLEAAMLFPIELSRALFEQSGQRRGRFTHGMLEILDHATEPELATFIYLAMTRPELRTAVVRRLEIRTDTEFFIEMLRQSWLVREGAVRRALAHVRRLAWLTDGIDSLLAIPSELLPRIPAWLLATGLPIEQKIDLLVQMTILNAPTTAIAAAWALTQISAIGATRALQRLVQHREPVIQRLATRALEHRRRIAHQADRMIEASPDAPVQASFEARFRFLWDHFDRLDHESCSEIGARMRRMAGQFVSATRPLLLSRIPEERTRALNMVTGLSLSDLFVNELSQLSSDEDSVVRAMVVNALAQAGGQSVRRILERALSDPEARVVANAIEALHRLGSEMRVDAIQPLLDHGNNRVRANAVAALLCRRVPEAAVTLLQMVTDPRRAHRLSALWLIEKTPLKALAGRVAELVENDPDESVRLKARRVLESLKHDPDHRRQPTAASIGGAG